MTLLVALLLSAPASQPADLWLRGRIERVGTVYSPQLNLITEDGKRYEVLGDLRAELRGLEHAKLDLQVVREREGQLPRIRVVRYKIVDIAGDHPEIGYVKLDGETVTIVIDPQTTWRLSDTGLSRRLKDRAGWKVWVVGKPVSNNQMKLGRFGFLAEPAATSKSASQPASQPE